MLTDVDKLPSCSRFSDSVVGFTGQKTQPTASQYWRGAVCMCCAVTTMYYGLSLFVLGHKVVDELWSSEARKTSSRLLTNSSQKANVCAVYIYRFICLICIPVSQSFLVFKFLKILVLPSFWDLHIYEIIIVDTARCVLKCCHSGLSSLLFFWDNFAVTDSPQPFTWRAKPRMYTGH